MNRVSILLGLIVMILLIIALGIWTMVLLRGSRVAAGQPASATAFFDYPSEPGYASGIDFTFMIGKPMTIPSNTMICTDPGDILAFWNDYNQAIKYGKDDERRQAVTTALAASCKITQSVTFGTIVADQPPSPASDIEWIIFKPRDGDANYWVQAAFVSP